jgi:hypothetical protein
MARRDTGKWVERAARTGSSRSYRGQTPINWYASLALICLLGLASVAYSRYERMHPSSGPAGTPPTVGTHWYAALAFDVCGKLEPNLPRNPNLGKPGAPGLYTDGTGVVDVAPKTASEAGRNATLARFASEYPGLVLQAGELRYPGHRLYTDGTRCPRGTPDAGRVGEVRFRVWPSYSSSHFVDESDPAAVRFASGQLITAAFVPRGAAIMRPPGKVVLALIDAITKSVGGATATTTSSVPTPPIPPGSTTSTTPSATTSTTLSTTGSTTTSTGHAPASGSTATTHSTPSVPSRPSTSPTSTASTGGRRALGWAPCGGRAMAGCARSPALGLASRQPRLVAR